MKKLLCLLCLITAPAWAGEETTEPAKQIDPAKVAEILTLTDEDVVLGQADAPLTLIEYSSLSCSHCANFHNHVLPVLKKEFIETGKLRFANRDFPLNPPAFKGAVIAQCAPKERRAKFYEVLFKLQDNWAYSADFETNLKKIGKVGGLSEETMNACLQDKAFEEAMLKHYQSALTHLQIQGTPTFFLNGERLNLPELKADLFVKALNEALK